MAGDVLVMMGRVAEHDNRNTFFSNSGSLVEAGKLFHGLSAGGTIEMPIAEAPLGAYWRMFTKNLAYSGC